MRRLLILLFVLVTAPAFAQTRTIVWDAPPEAATLAQANALTWLLTVNNGPAAVLPGAACTGTVAPFACAAPSPASLPAAYDTKVELQTQTPGGAVSVKSVPFITPTSAPTNVRAAVR